VAFSLATLSRIASNISAEIVDATWRGADTYMSDSDDAASLCVARPAM
jgi:hypothetical protein